MKYHFGVEEQCHFLYQLETQHNWEDPMVIYMKLGFSKGFSSLEFRIQEEYSCKYVLQIKFPLQMLKSSLICFYMQEVVTIGWMLSWLHWKYDYT